MGEIQFRDFVVADYESAVEFWSAIEGISLNESDSKDAISAFLSRNPGFSVIAADGAGSLYHLAVAKEFRGRGLGRGLVDFCFSRLAEASIPRCNIFVYTNNELGNRFWLSCGWSDLTSWKVFQKQVQKTPIPKCSSC
jgi:putative acetyltransferase